MARDVRLDPGILARLGKAPLPSPVAETPKTAKRKEPSAKTEPKHIAMARDLRDRYLEGVNSGRLVLESNAKYDVRRRLPVADSMVDRQPIALLPRMLAA